MSIRTHFGAWLLLAAWLTASPLKLYAAEGADPRQVWQLLDYIAVDYRGAVQNGEVVAPSEYAEMQEFAANAHATLERLPDKAGRAELLSKSQALVEAIGARSSPESVAKLAREIASAVLSVYSVPLAPRNPPDLLRGKTLFESTCSSCHGMRGAADGPAAKALSPPPIAFTDQVRARERSPFSYYQTITQGVEGTSMASFAALPESDRWALALYSGTLAYSDTQRRDGKRLWESERSAQSAMPTLEALVGHSEADLSASLGERAGPLLAYLRSAPAALAGNVSGGVNLVRSRLAESLQAYEASDIARAHQLALSAYLDGFEPLEPTLAATNASLLAKVEAAMATYRSGIDSRVPATQLASEAQQIQTLLKTVEETLSEQEVSATTAFLGSFAILLREGVEALLIVVAIVAFLRKAERRDLMPYVHGGWIGALLTGLVTWAIATYLVTISGANREITEGVSSLLAAVVLLIVGLWMHNKSLAGRWQHYLREKLSTALSQKSAWFLAGLAFVSVYREVFETILFYAAMWSQGGHRAILAGLVVAALALVLIAYILLRATRRLPIGKFFGYSSALIAVLAIVLVGKGIVALQEAGWIQIHAIEGPRVAVLGVYPNLQSILGQCLVGALIVAGILYNRAIAKREAIA